MDTGTIVRRLRDKDCEKCDVRMQCEQKGGACLLPGIAAAALKRIDDLLHEATQAEYAAERKYAALEKELARAKSEREYFKTRALFYSTLIKGDNSPIEAEGYKAFRGILKIRPRSRVPPYELYGDWIYSPETQCWYGNGRSYPEEICEIYELE